MSKDKQEDATEFLILMLAGIFNENQDDDAVLRSMNSHFFFKSRMRYQCQTCQTLNHTNPQVSNLINLSMNADGRDTVGDRRYKEVLYYDRSALVRSSVRTPPFDISISRDNKCQYALEERTYGD